MVSAGAFVIAKTRPAGIGLDQQQLYAIGLDYVRQLAGNVWTDHNVHDPGITMLELLAYALTDLTHRASMPVEDLLRTGTSTFFTAGEILPNHPLTVLDYRKLIIDVPGVKNAWLEAVELPYFADTTTGEIHVQRPNLPNIQPIALQGLWRVRLEYGEKIRNNAQKAEVNAAVMTRLQQHRNLTEDFLEVTGAQRQQFVMCGEIDIAPAADVAAVHAQIMRQVQEYLAPAVRWYTLAGILARPKPDRTSYTVPEVFDGPRLRNGFIATDELAASELRTEIRLSDIISIIMDIDGVVAVRDLLIAPKRAGRAQPLANRWVVPVESGKAATLDHQTSRLLYYKRHMPFLPPATAPPSTDSTPPGVAEDIAIPRGITRDFRTYYPVQHHFPALYAIGDNKPAPTGDRDADRRRRALAAQLKGYLLFFDQLMANYCAQLSEVAQLFSADPSVKATYFDQVVTQLADFAVIYGGAAKDDAAAIAKRLPAIETEDDRAHRRRRFLDHLIARFAERFHEYASIMRTAFEVTDASLEADRSAFLRNYPLLGANRSRAWNHTLTTADDLWKSKNTSGLEDRLAHLLGIGNSTRRDLTTVELGADVEIKADPPNQFGFTLFDRDVQNRVLLKEQAKHATKDLAGAQLLRALEAGQQVTTYETAKPANNKFIFTIKTKDGEVVGVSPEYRTSAERDAAIAELRTYLRRHYSREGLYVVENILLRPLKPGDASLHYCVDDDCVTCVDDPYSYRIHVVLPAYAGRFNDMHFRRFVEDVIREETPAHILPKICWISETHMDGFQKAYRAWLEARAAGDASAALKTLVERLTTVKNVYPVQKLAPCDAKDKDKFILGRGALGTKDNQ